MLKRRKAYESRTVLSEFEVEACCLPYKDNRKSAQISSRPLSAGWNSPQSGGEFNKGGVPPISLNSGLGIARIYPRTPLKN